MFVVVMLTSAPVIRPSVCLSVCSDASRSLGGDMSMSMSIKIFSAAKIAELLLFYEVHRGVVESQYKIENDCRKRNV